MDSDEFDLGMLATAFGKNVRELRSARGMQQEKLALIAGIDRGHMGKIERGETRVTLEKVYLIAKALGVSPASLLIAIAIAIAIAVALTKWPPWICINSNTPNASSPKSTHLHTSPVSPAGRAPVLSVAKIIRLLVQSRAGNPQAQLVGDPSRRNG